MESSWPHERHQPGPRLHARARPRTIARRPLRRSVPQAGEGAARPHDSLSSLATTPTSALGAAASTAPLACRVSAQRLALAGRGLLLSVKRGRLRRERGNAAPFLIPSSARRPGERSCFLGFRRSGASRSHQLGGVAVIRPQDGAVQALAGLAVSAPQPPGSTFKIVTVVAALEYGVATRSSTYPVATHATLSGVELRNAAGQACSGSLTEAFTVS
jgi:hypothetical protein